MVLRTAWILLVVDQLPPTYGSLQGSPPFLLQAVFTVVPVRPVQNCTFSRLFFIIFPIYPVDAAHYVSSRSKVQGC